MMKTIFDTIFAKNTKSSFVNTSQSAENTLRPQSQPPKSQANNAHHSSVKTANAQQTNNKPQVQDDIEFKNMAFESAYEVEEISLNDFKYTGPERRRFPRKPGETRSCYSKNNSAAQSAA